METQTSPVLVQTPAQIETLAALASEIYHEYFTIIITVEQIDYMVGKFLSVPVLTKAINEDGYEYYLFDDDEQPYAFCGIKCSDGDMFLSKLYVRVDKRGTGTGGRMLAFLEELCAERGLRSIWLTCNIGNADSLAFYDRKGFVTEEHKVADIGNGFVMDDYILRKTI